MKQYLTLAIVFIICILAIVGAWFWRNSQNKEVVSDANLDEKIVEYLSEQKVVLDELISDRESYQTKYVSIYTENHEQKNINVYVDEEDINFENNYTFGKWKLDSEKTTVYFEVTDKELLEQSTGKTVSELQSEYSWIIYE